MHGTLDLACALDQKIIPRQSSSLGFGASCSPLPSASAKGDTKSSDKDKLLIKPELFKIGFDLLVPNVIPLTAAVLGLDSALSVLDFSSPTLKLQFMKILNEQLILGRFPALFLNWKEREKSRNCYLPLTP